MSIIVRNHLLLCAARVVVLGLCAAAVAVKPAEAAFVGINVAVPGYFHAPDALFTLNPGIQALLELAGGVLVALGWVTRPVAFALAGDMAVAYFMAHSPKGFFPLLNGGELAIV